MLDKELRSMIGQVKDGRIDRRAFIQRMAAVGLTAPLANQILALGGVGVVSVASNIAPKLMGELVTAALTQDYQRARELHYTLLPLFRGIFLQSNPIPVKHILAAKEMIGEVYRLPLTPLDEADAAAVDAIVSKVRPE